MKKAFSLLCCILCFSISPVIGQEDAGNGEDKGFLQKLIKNFSKEEQKGPDVISKYSFIYNLIHFEEKHTYDSLREAGIDQWSLANDTLFFAARYDSLHLASDIKVFGWHPYWVGPAYQNYQFNLLSHVAWFSYDVNPQTGGPRNPSVVEEWKNTTMIDSAHQYGCKVLLTITSLEAAGNQVFLGDPLAQEMLMDSIIDLITIKNADGIAVNFEQIPIDRAKAFTNFILELSAQLKAVNKDYVLALSIPKINAGRIHKIKSLNKAVDLFVMTGYDYHTSVSKKDGPIAPLRASGRGRSIELSVSNYLNQGLEPSKLLVGLPYYGGVWQEDGSFVRHLTYRAIKSKYDQLGVPQMDETSASVFYRDSSKIPLEIIWFEDSASLALKYDWVIQNELGGIGLWALGYDNSQPELWELIADKFTSDSTMMHKKLNRGVLFNLATALRKEKDILSISGIFIIFFLAIGFVAALFDWRVREVFFSNKSYRLIFITGFFILIFLLYLTYLFLSGKAVFSNPVFIIIFGLFLGSLLTFQIGRRYYKWRKNLP